MADQQETMARSRRRDVGGESEQKTKAKTPHPLIECWQLVSTVLQLLQLRTDLDKTSEGGAGAKTLKKTLVYYAIAVAYCCRLL